MKLLYVRLVLLGALALSSCKKESFLYNDVPRLYLTGDASQGAEADSVYISFKLHKSDIEAYEVYVYANIRGYTSDKDRIFTLEPDWSNSNVGPEDFAIGQMVVPAGASKGKVAVSVKRQVADKNLLIENAFLTLKVVKNENFDEAEVEGNSYKIVWCDYLTQPATWSIIQSYVGPFTQARYKFIIDVTGKTEFSFLNGNFNQLNSFQSQLKRALLDYNADPANADRPEGWPYLNDDGVTPLQIGSGLTV